MTCRTDFYLFSMIEFQDELECMGMHGNESNAANYVIIENNAFIFTKNKCNYRLECLYLPGLFVGRVKIFLFVCFLFSKTANRFFLFTTSTSHLLIACTGLSEKLLKKQASVSVLPP